MSISGKSEAAGKGVDKLVNAGITVVVSAGNSKGPKPGE